jgi:hypothetical protein
VQISRSSEITEVQSNEVDTDDAKKIADRAHSDEAELDSAELQMLIGLMGLTEGDAVRFKHAFNIAAEHRKVRAEAHARRMAAVPQRGDVPIKRLDGFQNQNIGHAAHGYCLPKACSVPRIVKNMFGPSEDCQREDEKEREKNAAFGVANFDLITESLNTAVCIGEGLLKGDGSGKAKGNEQIYMTNGICSEPAWQSVIEVDAMDHSYNYWFRPLDRDMPPVSPVYTPRNPYGGPTYTGRNLLKPWFSFFAQSAREVEDVSQVGQGMRLSSAQNAEMQMPDAWVGANADSNGREMIRKESEKRMMGVQGAAAQRLVENVVGTEITLGGKKLAEAERYENRIFSGNTNISADRLGKA